MPSTLPTLTTEPSGMAWAVSVTTAGLALLMLVSALALPQAVTTAKVVPKNLMRWPWLMVVCS